MFDLDSMFILIMLGIIFVFNFPSILLLMDYYQENKDIILGINSESNLIEIRKNGITKRYKLTEIESSTYNLGEYYQNRIDNAARWSMLHSDFGYWDLKFEDKERYYISNFLIDFLHDEPFIENTEYRFRMFPFIDKSKSKKAMELKEIQEMERVAKLRENYAYKTIAELKYIIENKEKYQDSAVNVAQEILNKKTLSNSHIHYNRARNE